MDFSRAFSFPFQDPDWLKKVGLAALVFLIPLVGPIVLMGWGLEITRRVIDDDPEPLPAWTDFGGYLSKGFKAFVVALAYMLPVILIVICGQVINIGLVAALANSNSDAAGGVVIALGVCASCLAIILGLAAGFILPAANGRLAAGGQISDAFRFNEVFGMLRAAPGPYLMVIGGVFLANIILAPLGSLVCGIGVLITTAFTTCLGGHLTGQAYKAAKAAQGL